MTVGVAAGPERTCSERLRWRRGHGRRALRPLEPVRHPAALRRRPAGATPALFADAGVALLRDQRAARRAVVPGRPRPARVPVVAAHAHADALASRCGSAGSTSRRPGHLCYGAEPAWRAYFRSTVAHNTLEVGGVDHRGGRPHLWHTGAGRAGAGRRLDGGPWPSGGPPPRLPGSSPARPHRRSVRPGRPARRLVVETGSKPRRARLPVASTSGPRWPRAGGEPGRPGVAGRAGRGRATLSLPASWSGRAGRAERSAGRVVLAAFDERVPTVTLLGTGRVAAARPCAPSCISPWETP